MSEPALTLKEAALRLDEVADRACRLGESTLLTADGKPVARIVPVEAAKHTVGGLLEWLRAHERLDSAEADMMAVAIDEFRRQHNRPPDPSRWD